MHILSRFLANLVGVWLSAQLIRGFHINGSWRGYLVAALVLALLNLLVKPVLKIVTFPLIIISLGLFGLVINIFILWLADKFTGYIVIDNPVALIWATIVITAVNIISHWL